MPAATTPRRNGPYAPLSAFYAEDDAVIALEMAGNDLAELLFLRALAYCAREPRLAGTISKTKLRRIFDRPLPKLMKAAETLVAVGLWETDGGGWRIKRWSKWNRTEQEIARIRQQDRDRKAGGAVTDSARNPDGTEADSAHQYIAVQDTSVHGSSNLPAAAAKLREELDRAGLRVSWDVDTLQALEINQAAERCGVPALVKNAKSRYQPNDPAFSVKAFLPGWATLPAAAPALELVPDPCDHGEAFRSRCALCRVAS